MRILLPPSEGKTAPAHGRPVVLHRLAAPSLRDDREAVLSALVRLCSGPAGPARSALGLGPRQDREITRNTRLREAPAAPAIEVYTGVLFDALDVATLTSSARARLAEITLVQSALFGVVAAGDAIPAYRLSADSTLPPLGVMSRWWAPRLHDAMTRMLSAQPVLDLRSGAYRSFWTPAVADYERIAVARVLSEDRRGKRTVISHHNKATKGLMVRALVTSRRRPRTIHAIVGVLADAGFTVDVTEPTTRTPWALDVIVPAGGGVSVTR